MWLHSLSLPWTASLMKRCHEYWAYFWCLFPLVKFNWGTIFNFILKGTFWLYISIFRALCCRQTLQKKLPDWRTAWPTDWFTGWMDEVDGGGMRSGTLGGWVVLVDGRWLGGLGKVGEVKAGMVHPSSPIGQTGQRVLCSFEALKWTEFHHGHGDCSMSFVRNFGEMVLKMGRLAHAWNAEFCF